MATKNVARMEQGLVCTITALTIGPSKWAAFSFARGTARLSETRDDFGHEEMRIACGAENSILELYKMPSWSPGCAMSMLALRHDIFNYEQQQQQPLWRQSLDR